MLVYCARCGEKQTASNETCLRCGFVIGERQKFNPFERAQLQKSEQNNTEEHDRFLYDLEEDVSLLVRILFAVSNPWRKRWRRGLIWRMNLLLLAFLFVGLFGYGGYFAWTVLTYEEINNLFRTASRY
jgi:hypothetical protein